MNKLNSNELTLKYLKQKFPPTQAGNGETGFIPMFFVECFLNDIKKIVKTNGLRRFYRGPRRPNSTHTFKHEATFMVLYRK